LKKKITPKLMFKTKVSKEHILFGPSGNKII